jgi:hypothetical protein
MPQISDLRTAYRCGGYAARGLSSSTGKSEYHRRNTLANLLFNVLTCVWSGICWRLQKRLVMTWFMVDSTNLVLIHSPQRHRSPLLWSLYR